jgi:hypothetical protein
MRLRAVVLSFSALLALAYPFFSSISEGLANGLWIAEPLFLTLLLFAASAGIRQKSIQYICIIAASFFLAFAAAETYFTLLPVDPAGPQFHSQDSVYVKSGRSTHLYEQGYSSPDPVLGYGPSLNGTRRIAARRVKGDKVIYDVLYSRDEAGRRITPDRGDKADTAILLFGCSLTVGEGLNDQETFAWQLGEMLGERFQVFNYGFHGYGAHQMLALVESGRLDALATRYKQIYAFYLTIRGHAVRCAGLSPWDQSGPRYVLQNGAITHVGSFNETREHNKLHQADVLFARSRLYAYLKETYRQQAIPEHALRIHIAIIAQAMHELEARYHAHALTVIWPNFTGIEPVLREKGVHTLELTGAMPDYTSAREKYSIQGDGHPNALANTRIAETLSEYILKNTRAPGKQP